MTGDELPIAYRVLGLRRTRWGRATRNGHPLPRKSDQPTVSSLIAKGHLEYHDNGYRMTSQGISQLKLQIGEF